MKGSRHLLVKSLNGRRFSMTSVDNPGEEDFNKLRNTIRKVDVSSTEVHHAGPWLYSTSGINC
ncbi:hypothetical protein DERF_006319 [Dermatophagoides farinae]|uniref:Uncharacterized protein n=1 Tax=Dermatophagoides farinae TaxID=6954 RepID=A0A922LC22_DERFA|nr:hypothetical protein DERF_006319 [Dermatophagoides farinae]